MPTLSVEPTLFNITNTDVSYQMTGTYNLSIEPRSFTITDTDAAITKDSNFRIEPRFFRINPQSALLDYAEPVSSDFLYTIAGGSHHDDIFPYTIHRGDIVPVKIDWQEILDPQESILTAEVMASGLTATSLTTDGTTTRFILSNVITTSVADVVLKVETSDVRTLVRTIRVRTWYEPDVCIPPAPPGPTTQTFTVEYTSFWNLPTSWTTLGVPASAYLYGRYSSATHGTVGTINPVEQIKGVDIVALCSTDSFPGNGTVVVCLAGNLPQDFFAEATFNGDSYPTATADGFGTSSLTDGDQTVWWWEIGAYAPPTGYEYFDFPRQVAITH